MSGLRILVVEDEAIIALDLAQTLEDAGAVVAGPASTLEAALELCERESFSCAVLDVRLRGEEVFPVADVLTARSVPFAFHTGHADADVLKKRWPGSAVLRKPAPPDLLVEFLARLMGRG